MKKDAKVVHSPQLANYLLERGFTIIKLKPKRGTERESVFVFRMEDGLEEIVAEWMEQGN
jgi:predicted CoA-binding protein